MIILTHFDFFFCSLTKDMTGKVLFSDKHKIVLVMCTKIRQLFYYHYCYHYHKKLLSSLLLLLLLLIFF